MIGRTVDIAHLAAFRILFGLTMAFSMVRFIAYGWIDPFFVEPTFHFKYYGFAWVEPLGATGMHALFWILAVLALLIALGLLFRAAAISFAIGFAYLQLIDVTNYLNHYYLAALLAFLLAISPAHRAWSVDAWHGVVAPADEIGAAWQWWFRWQVGVVYTFAGIAKATSDWLLHAQPLRIWLASRTGFPVVGKLFAEPWAAYGMSWGGFLFDSTIIWFLLWRRTRVVAFVVVVLFHAATRMLFPIGMFSVIMVVAATLFLDASWPRRWLRFVTLKRTGGVGKFPRWAVPVAIAYCAVQVVVPLRFLAYGGDMNWHEQGMRFSWRVMVREKNGSVVFKVHDPETGRTVEVQPRKYLTRVQEREMSSQPDLILQLAHRIREEMGGGVVEVRAEAIASLNGRPAAVMIDPAVDLGAVEDGLGRANWIQCE